MLAFAQSEWALTSKLYQPLVANEQAFNFTSMILYTDGLTSNSSFMKLFLVSLLSNSVNASLPLATPSSTEKYTC